LNLSGRANNSKLRSPRRIACRPYHMHKSDGRVHHYTLSPVTLSTTGKPEQRP